MTLLARIRYLGAAAAACAAIALALVQARTRWAVASFVFVQGKGEPSPAGSVGAPAFGDSPASARARILYLPDASPAIAASSLPAGAPVVAKVVPERIFGRCPAEMVEVENRFCIDRFEATLVDAISGHRLSPYYHPTPGSTRREYDRWREARADAPTSLGRSMAVPAPDDWQLSATHFEPKAVVEAGAIPNGYLSGDIAERACKNAGKRLCSPEEWVLACRGKQRRQFPYGELYEDGRCNVFRSTHPARALHGDSSAGHLDPRLNQVEEERGAPLLRATGATPECKSEWSDDSAYDMVGNLDEWVDDPDGTFVGGFYARSTRDGCDARVEVHSYDYYDYSLGTRCCENL